LKAGGKLIYYHILQNSLIAATISFENEKIHTKAADGVPFQIPSETEKNGMKSRTTIAGTLLADPNANGLQTGESCGLNSGT
jgi:hypothetical protein